MSNLVFYIKGRIYNLRSEHTLGVFDNRLRKKILGPKREQVIGICMIHTRHQNYEGEQTQEDEIGTECGEYGGRDMRTGFLLRNEKERDHLSDLGVDDNIT
jgi:hypothetical protein